MVLTAVPALADDTGGLTGRTVIFNVLTYNDPTAPIFIGPEFLDKVTNQSEFGMNRTGIGGLSVVPVQIDLSDGRIDFSYAQGQSGQFAVAKFNGYVLYFPTDCVLISGAALDPETTTLALTTEDLIVTPQSLSINVEG